MEKLAGGFERFRASVETGTFATPAGKPAVGAHRIRYAVFYETGGKRFWDNAAGANFTVEHAKQPGVAGVVGSGN